MVRPLRPATVLACAALLASLPALVGCGGPERAPVAEPDADAGGSEGEPNDPPPAGDGGDGGAADAGSDSAGSDAGSTDAGSTDAGSTDAGSTDGGPATGPGTAPAGAVPGEVVAHDTQAVQLAAGERRVFRVDAAGAEHVGLKLTWTPGPRAVTLSASRWDGHAPAALGTTDAGAGLRVLAVLDRDGPRTFWATVQNGPDALAATLSVVRTPFKDGLRCTGDCDRLLQLPLPNLPDDDGYALDGAIFRYQFGRRDLLQLLRDAGHRLAGAGFTPFHPMDLSQWDGQTPGTDVGAPRHASHQRGKDGDISLYGTDGLSIWRSFCTTRPVSGGRECVPGSRSPLFDARGSARLIGAFYDSGRVTMDFLDRELIAAAIPAAQQLGREGLLAAAVVPLFGDGSHLQHWPNHDNHVHVRVSETAYGLAPGPDQPAIGEPGWLVEPAAEPFEAP